MAIFATAASASAEPRRRSEPADPWAIPSAITVHTGLNLPFGTGVAYEHAFVPRAFAAEVGVGGGFVGPQGALAVRGRVAGTNLAFGFRVGTSAGPYEADGHSWDLAAWAFYDLGLEVRGDFGFQASLYAGVAGILNPDDNDPCPLCRQTNRIAVGFVGVSLGHALVF